MADSPNKQVTLLVEGQASAELSVNDFINRFDAISHLAVENRHLTTPPGGESNGECWLINGVGAAAWLNHDDEIAIYYDGWLFLTPHEGLSMWVKDEDITLFYDGSAWVLPSASLADDHVNKLLFAYVSATQVSIDDGCAVSSDGTDLIEVTSLLTLDITGSGANGLDTGAEATSTWYYAYVIKNPVSGAVAGLLSVSADSPTMPAGYTKKRRVGIVRNDAGDDFLKFYQRGFGRTRIYWYDEDVSVTIVLSGGSAVGFTAVDLSAFVPPVSKEVHLLVGFSTGGVGAATNYGRLRPDGASSTDPLWKIKPAFVSAEMAFWQIEMPCDSAQAIDYRVTNANNDMDISVQGFEDDING